MKDPWTSWITIDLDAVIYNAKQIRSLIKDKLFYAVVKANAYGHGALHVARTLEPLVDGYCVATLEEAIELRTVGIIHPILVFGHVPVEKLYEAIHWNISVTIHSLTYLYRIKDLSFVQPLQVHLKIDTGMHRIGLITEEEVNQAFQTINQTHHLKLTGIYTHLATADEEDGTYYYQQLNTFQNYIKAFDTSEITIHVHNSSGLLNYPMDLFDAVRIGILLYGINPFPQTIIHLKPVLRLSTRIVQCKKVSPHQKISYSCTYETTDWEWIGTLPIGYADGYDRNIQKGLVYVNEVPCPIVGHICMDMMMVRLPHHVSLGTKVELIGPYLSIESLATMMGKIPYEVLVQWSSRIPRVYVQEGKIVEVKSRF